MYAVFKSLQSSKMYNIRNNSLSNEIDVCIFSNNYHHAYYEKIVFEIFINSSLVPIRKTSIRGETCTVSNKFKFNKCTAKNIRKYYVYRDNFSSRKQ